MNTVNTTETKTLEEAIKLLPTLSKSKFVGAVNVDIVLNLKEKNKKEVIRGSVSLPHQMGEDKKVIVFCEEKDEKAAKEAGAYKVGLETLMEELLKGNGDFDIVIATPAVMPKIVRLGKVLGPKGLMPNPKNGTVTDDLAKAVSSFKGGKMNFKTATDQGVIRTKVAKLDMKAEEIHENVMELLKAVANETRKFALNPFKKITLSPTMGAGVKLDTNDIMKSL